MTRERGLGGAMTTSKLMDSPHSHSKGNSVLKGCWADMPYVCWGEHCLAQSTFILYMIFIFCLQSVDVVVKFLKKASANLRAPFSVIVPNHKLPLRERRRMLAKQLAEFVMLYRKVSQSTLHL